MATGPSSIRTEINSSLYSPLATRPAPMLPVEFAPAGIPTIPLPKNVSLQASQGDKTHALATELLQPSSPEVRSQKILDTLLVDSKKQAVPGNHMIAAVQQKFVEFMEAQFTKTTAGKSEPTDDDQVFKAKSLLELSQTVFQEAAKAQAELDKMEQLDGVEVAKQKMELWAWAEKKHLELLKAQEELAALQQKRKMEKESHDFRHKMELLKEQSKNAHKDWEYLLKVQELKANGKINSETSTGNLPGLPQTDTLLHQAVKSGDIWLVKLLLQAKFPKNKRDEDGNTPLACALEVGKLEIAKLFEPTKKDTQLPNIQKQTLLHLAVQSGDLECVKWIFSKNKDLLETRNATLQTPLFCAVAANHLHIAKFLLEQGARLEVVDNDGKTLIDCAFDHEEDEMVEWLMAHAPQLLKKEGKNRYQAVTHAIRKGKIALAEKMLEKGASFDIRIPANQTLMLDVAEKGFCECIVWLIRKGLSVNILNSSGCTPILAAIFEGKVAAVICLLKHGAKTTSPHMGTVWTGNEFNFKPTTLAQAALYSVQPIEILEEVIKSSDDLFTEGPNNYIPLQIAVLRGLLSTAKYLLQHKFHNDPQSRRLETLLLLAVQANSMEMVQWVYSIIPKTVECVFPALRAAIGYDDLEMAQWIQQESKLQLDTESLFCWAKKGKKWEMLMWILSFPHVDPNYSDPDRAGQTPFLAACEAQNLEGAMSLIANGASPKINDQDGFTPWHYISFSSSPPSFIWIQKLKVLPGISSVNTKSKDGITPLQLAVSKGHERLAHNLEAEMKADPSGIDNESRTLLHLAAQSGRREAVQYAFSKCKKLNAKTKGGTTAIEVAVSTESYLSANYLFDQGADLPDNLELLKKYFLYAASEDVPRVIDKMLGIEHFKKIFDPNLKASAFGEATLNGHFSLALRFMNEIVMGVTLDFVFEVINRAKDPVKALEFLYANLKTQIPLESDFPPRHALLEAVRKKQKKTADFLVTKEMRKSGRSGKLFKAAIESGSLEMVEWAYERSFKMRLSAASCIEQDQYPAAIWCYKHNIPFHSAPIHFWAKLNGSLEMLLFLIPQGFEIETRNLSGKTPLYVALWYQRREAAQILIDRNASLNFSKTEKQEILEAVLYSMAFSPSFFEWLLTLGEWPLLGLDEKGFTLLEGAVFLGRPQAAHVLIQKGVSGNFTKYRQEIISQFGQHAQMKQPFVDYAFEPDHPYNLNCINSFEHFASKSVGNNASPLNFSINNPIHRILLPLSIIHGLEHLLKALLNANMLSIIRTSVTSQLYLHPLIYAVIYRRRDIYNELHSSKKVRAMPLKVNLADGYIIEGNCLPHLMVLAEDETLGKDELTWRRELSNFSTNDKVKLYKGEEFIDELTTVQFVVLNPLKLKHAVVIINGLTHGGTAIPTTKTKNGKGLQELAALSQDPAIIEWINKHIKENEDLLF